MTKLTTIIVAGIAASYRFHLTKRPKDKGIEMLGVLTVALLIQTCVVLAGDQILVSAPMTTDLSGKTANIAYPSVFRIICNGDQGTGFLHRSGRIITALHVVDGCPVKDIKVLRIVSTPSGVAMVEIGVTNVVADTNSDLALLTPAEPINAPSLPITTNGDFKIGSQVCTWGFPGGYPGAAPLLSAGYLSGIQWNSLTNGIQVPMYVVNAAFNGGNSGGPLVDVESGAVIGVVVSKLAPIPPQIENIVDSFSKEKSGIVYGVTYENGQSGSVSEAQLVAEMVNYLRSQIQLVIGYAATPGNLRSFLKAQGIDP